MIHVYHAVKSTFFVRPDFKYSPSDFVLVATVDTNDREQAFQLTNSIEDFWGNNAKVTYLGPEEGCRSTSVGDLLHVEGQLWLIDGSGFREITSW